MTEKISVNSWVLFCDLEQKYNNEVVSLSNHVPGSMKQVMNYMPFTSLWMKPHELLVKPKISVSYINTHWFDEVLWGTVKIIFKIAKYLFINKICDLKKTTIIFQRCWAKKSQCLLLKKADHRSTYCWAAFLPRSPHLVSKILPTPLERSTGMSLRIINWPESRPLLHRSSLVLKTMWYKGANRTEFQAQIVHLLVGWSWKTSLTPLSLEFSHQQIENTYLKMYA